MVLLRFLKELLLVPALGYFKSKEFRAQSVLLLVMATLGLLIHLTLTYGWLDRWLNLDLTSPRQAYLGASNFWWSLFVILALELWLAISTVTVLACTLVVLFVLYVFAIEPALEEIAKIKKHTISAWNKAKGSGK